MTQMRVKDLIQALQAVDPELPVHKFAGAGEFSPVDTDYAGHWMNYQNLMQSKNDESYFGLANDQTWEKVRGEFHEPFQAVVFW